MGAGAWAGYQMPHKSTWIRATDTTRSRPIRTAQPDPAGNRAARRAARRAERRRSRGRPRLPAQGLDHRPTRAHHLPAGRRRPLLDGCTASSVDGWTAGGWCLRIPRTPGRGLVIARIGHIGPTYATIRRLCSTPVIRHLFVGRFGR